MKFHTPFFIIGFVLIALPLLGLPRLYQDISTITFGIALMLVSASANFSRVKNKIDMMSEELGIDEEEMEEEYTEEETTESEDEKESPTYEEMTEMIADLEEKSDDEELS